jgi:HD superfamily phosphohydrolase
MKVIRDPVHGSIELDDLEVSLIDTPLFQRLRRIRQLGFASLVYPGANHTRFEHSLGTMHLASVLTSGMDTLGDVEKKELRAAALLHDIGHGPLSHVTEELIEKYTRKKHEDVKSLLKGGEIADIFGEHGLDGRMVADHITGKTSAGQIIHSEIDVDRMDYLTRDAHYTGVAYGITDHSRLIHKMRFYEGKLVVEEGGLSAAESLLVSRFLMYPAVYYHHVSRIAETMFTRAVEDMILEHKLEPRKMQRMDDSQLIGVLRRDDGHAGEVMHRIDGRRLYKRALYAGFESVSERVPEYHAKTQRIEIEIAEDAGVEIKDVLVDIPGLSRIEEMNAHIRSNGRLLRLDEASHIVATLESAHRDNWRMGVYAPPEHLDTVKKTAGDYFDVKKPTTQYHLSDLGGLCGSP